MEEEQTKVLWFWFLDKVLLVWRQSMKHKHRCFIYFNPSSCCKYLSPLHHKKAYVLEFEVFYFEIYKFCLLLYGNTFTLQSYWINLHVQHRGVILFVRTHDFTQPRRCSSCTYTLFGANYGGLSANYTHVTQRFVAKSPHEAVCIQIKTRTYIRALVNVLTRSSCSKWSGLNPVVGSPPPPSEMEALLWISTKTENMWETGNLTIHMLCGTKGLN